jgi:hypothetical protein
MNEDRVIISLIGSHIDEVRSTAGSQEDAIREAKQIMPDHLNGSVEIWLSTRNDGYYGPAFKLTRQLVLTNLQTNEQEVVG